MTKLSPSLRKPRNYCFLHVCERLLRFPVWYVMLADDISSVRSFLNRSLASTACIKRLRLIFLMIGNRAFDLSAQQASPSNIFYQPCGNATPPCGNARPLFWKWVTPEGYRHPCQKSWSPGHGLSRITQPRCNSNRIRIILKKPIIAL